MTIKPRPGPKGPRAIFQEVGEAPPPPVQKGMIDTRPRGARGAIRAWLALIVVLAVALSLWGGWLRLAGQGLGAYGFDPGSVVIPPRSEAAWQAEYLRFLAWNNEAMALDAPEGDPPAPGAVATDSAPVAPDAPVGAAATAPAGAEPTAALAPEGLDAAGPAAAADMIVAPLTPAEFRAGWLADWAHRAGGIALGAVWALGLALFAATGRIPPGWGPRLALPGALIAAQAAVGIALSGPLAIALHLLLALALVGIGLWHVLGLSRTEAALLQARRSAEPRLAAAATGIMHATLLTAALGGLMAGLDGGRGFTDWPLMGGRVIPEGLLAETPVWRNLIDNPALVQFLHRLAAYAVVALAILGWSRARASAQGATRGAFALVAVAALVQAALGVLTVTQATPVALGLAHQAAAFAIFAAIIRARHRARFPIVQSVRGTIR